MQIFFRKSIIFQKRVNFDRIFFKFLDVKLSGEETVCVIVRHFYTDFQLILDLSRKFSSSGYFQTFSSKIPRIFADKWLASDIYDRKFWKRPWKWKFWKAHTFPPSDKNNWQGQKCMLKTVIFKVSCSETFFPKIFADSKNFSAQCRFYSDKSPENFIFRKKLWTEPL